MKRKENDMKKRVILTMLPIIAIAFETLPYGAVLKFATSDADIVNIQTYSYFDLVPFGYANFGPFLTAILTLLILVFAALNLFKPNDKISKAITVSSVIAVITSLMPLMFGVAYFSVIGAIITLILIIEVLVSILLKD